MKKSKNDDGGECDGGSLGSGGAEIGGCSSSDKPIKITSGKVWFWCEERFWWWRL